MKDANVAIFEKIKAYSSKLSGEFGITDGVRYFFSSDSDKIWLKDLIILEKQSLTLKLQSAIFNFKAEKYFVVVGDADQLVDDDAFFPIEINAGLFTALVSELSIPIRYKTEPLDLIESVLGQSSSVEGYTGHNFRDAEKYFESIFIYKINPDSAVVDSDVFRISALFFAKKPNNLMLPFSQKTQGAFQKLILEGNDEIPFEGICHCLISINWKYAFLELYRCIENLFSMPRLLELNSKLGLSISMQELSAHLESCLSWRPKDDESIGKLFEALPENFESDFRIIRGIIPDMKTTKFNVWLYTLRNRIVHYRASKMPVIVDDSMWDKLIECTLIMIPIFYSKFAVSD